MNIEDIIDTVDSLGAVKARIAELQAKEKALVADLKARGDGTYIGRKYEAVVFTSERTQIDWKSVAAAKKISDNFLAKFSSLSESVTLKVTARKT